MNSDLANDDAERSGFPSTSGLVAASTSRSVPEPPLLESGGVSVSGPAQRPRRAAFRRPIYRRRRSRAVAAACVAVLLVLLVAPLLRGWRGFAAAQPPSRRGSVELAGRPDRADALLQRRPADPHRPLRPGAWPWRGASAMTSPRCWRGDQPYVADADLAFCHVETPMTPDPPTSYPIFNTPPELAEGHREDRVGRLQHRLQPHPRPGRGGGGPDPEGAGRRGRRAHRFGDLAARRATGR